LSYNYASNVDAYIGADLLYGDPAQLFGQFDHADRISIGLNWGF
jgi:hypothetical protein